MQPRADYGPVGRIYDVKDIRTVKVVYLLFTHKKRYWQQLLDLFGKVFLLDGNKRHKVSRVTVVTTSEFPGRFVVHNAFIASVKA